MSMLQKDFTIPGVAYTLQEDQENKTLKVTLLSSEWKSSTNGDLSTINRELAIQLAKHPNVDVSVLLPNCSEADRSSAESHNVKLVEADRVPGFEPVLCLSFPPRDHKIDCVIGHGVHLGQPIVSMKRNPNYSHCKWIQVVHSASEEVGMYRNTSKGQKMQETEIQLCKMADQVITIGPKLAEAYKCYLRPVKQEEKVFDLTPSIFSEFLVVEQAAKERRTFLIFVIGSGDSCEDFNVKGYDIAAKAIAELKDESYKLKFVCAAGGKEDIVAENLLHHGIRLNQLIVCSCDDNREVLANLFCEVDLAIMPSRTEGFGTTALEALSAGLPVLVSGNSGLGEALKKVLFGSQSVVDSEDPKEWAREIKRVRQKERDVRLLESRFLREKYLEKYSWEEPCKSLVIKMKNLVFGKALHSSLDYEETERNKQGESIPEKAPNTSLKRKRTDGDEQTKSVQVKIPIRIDCGTIPDPHPQLETSGTVVIASQSTQAGSDGLVLTKMSEGTPQDTQDSQAVSHELLVTEVKCKALESVASGGQPFIGRTGSIEEAGVGNKAVPNTQNVLNSIALKYLKKVDPSKPEELNGFPQYLKDVRKVLVRDVQPGSLMLSALCSSLEILDALWYDYCTGHLNDMARKYLVTTDILKEFDLTELKLTATIQGEEYIAARKLFLRGSEKAPNTSLKRKRTDGNEETKSVQGNLPHSGVQVGKRDGREQSESAPDSGIAPRDSPEEVRAATSMALEGAAGYVSTKKTQRNTKEVWTATERAPNTSLRRRRTDGNEQTKSVQDSGIAPRDSTEEELKNKKEVSAATCRAVEGAAAYDSAEQAERNTKEVGTAAGSAVEGATPYDSAEQAQRNTREVWTATAHEKQEVPYYTSGKGLADGEDATVDTEGNQKTLIKSGKIGDKEDTWHLREAGASIKLNSEAVQLPLPFTCRCLLWNPKTLSPPTASDEILVSSVIELSHDGPPDLDYGESIEGLSFTVALLHSAPDLEGYEVVIKQLTDLENNEWKELKTENTWHGSETSTVPKWLFPFAQAVCAKSAVSSFAAIWRPKSFTFSRGTAVGPELTCIVPDFPDVSVQIPQSCVPVNQDFSVTIKVQEFPSSELKGEEGLVGPGLYISGSQNVTLVAPVTIRIPLTLRKEKQELAELCPGELRILHCESLVELHDWKDITDQLDEPPRLLDGIVQFKLRHFCGFRPIKLIGSLLQSASGLKELVRRLSSSSRPQYARFSTCLCETSVDGHFGLKLFCYPQKLQYDVDRQISSCIAPQKCEGSSRKPVCVEEKILVFLSEAIIPQGTDEKNALQFVRFLENEVFYSGGEVCLKSGSVPKVKFKDQSEDLLCNLPIGKASPVPVPVTFDHKEGNDIPMVKDGEPTDLELEYLSLELAEKWETLARRLEVNPAAITDFGKPNEGLAAKAFKILLAWKQKEGSKATYKALYDALCHELVECRRQAEKFCCERL